MIERPLAKGPQPMGLRPRAGSSGLRPAGSMPARWGAHRWDPGQKILGLRFCCFVSLLFVPSRYHRLQAGKRLQGVVPERCS